MVVFIVSVWTGGKNVTILLLRFCLYGNVTLNGLLSVSQNLPVHTGIHTATDQLRTGLGVCTKDNQNGSVTITSPAWLRS